MAEVVIVALLALAAPKVVIDPGHGGEKTGTKNAAGVYEKEITLSVARHAKKALEAAGVEVVLTRSGDADVKLSERVTQANTLGAEVFVSIHANSSPSAARVGAETYILSPESSDGDAASVVHVENEEETQEQSAAPAEAKSDLELILGDLSRATAHKDSAALAKRLQERVAAVGGLGPSRGLRQAPFLVLRGAAMPAALVELGYLSNVRQGETLADPGVQKAAGQAIAEAVRAFLAAQAKAHAR